MLGIARFAMKSPVHAGILAALFAVVPVLYVFSAALVALTTLRFGLTAGTRILMFAFAGSLVSWLLSGVPLSLLVLVLVTFLAVTLRETQRWERTLLVGLVLGILFAMLSHVLFQDLLNSLMDIFQQIVSAGRVGSTEWQLIELIRPMAGYVLLTSQVGEALLALLLARYWQAGLFNPGGLKAEMHALRFTWQEASVLMVAMLIAVIIQPGALMLFGIPFVFAGMALIHGVVAKLKLGGQWLVAMYIGLFLLNQIIVPLLILFVLVDAFFDIRKRIPESPNKDNE